MKLTLSWLKAHLDTSASLQEITSTLTKIGLEVEGIEDPAAKVRGFSIAYVISAEKHPNADKLRVCMVDDGSGTPVQVVCGAPNARAGMKSVFSPAGTFIPGKNITLAKGVIRGVESNGMLCSAFELELSEDHDGIIDLPADAPIGVAYGDYLGLNDPVIDINLTPNRPDAAGIYGIARDLAAAGLGVLKTQKIVAVKGEFPCPVAVKLDVAPHLAPAFALRLVRGVKNGPSPEWMQARLRAIGLRPISALVDITNFMTFDQGRPLHVFDANKVSGALHVRLAHSGERIVSLDGKTYTLDESTVVIADDKGVESIAGIMGGEASGCDEHTTDVLIESALWDPTTIARTGRNLSIVSDARYRFERGIDPAFCVPGAEMATQLVLDICGGTPSDLILAGQVPVPEKTVTFPYAETKRLTGLDVGARQANEILTKLGFTVAPDGTSAQVKVPSWRPDIDEKADIVEEIIRIVGLEHVESTPLLRLETAVPKPVLTLLQKRTRGAKRALATRGLVEAVTWSFISKERATLFGGGAPELALANPIAADLSDMRPSLLPGLLSAAQRNADRGTGDVALFEVGQIFKGDSETDQFIAASAIRRGTAKPAGAGRHWSGTAHNVDLFDAKADALAVLASLGVVLSGLQISPKAPNFYHPGRSGILHFGPNIIGHFGEFHPNTLEALDISGPLCGFEIILDKIPAQKAKPTKVKGKLVLSEFMPLERDFAFVVDASVPAADVLKVAQSADRALITDGRVFDVYAGPGIASGKKSVAIALTLQPREKTLTDVELDAVAAKIVADVTKKTGGILRG